MKFWHPFWLVTTIALKQVVAEGPSWTIYHSWNGGKDYARRGVLEWKNDDDGLVVTNDEAALTPAQLHEMLAFGWYQVKIDTGDSDYILSTVPACNLRRANFRDEFSVTLPRAGSEQQITSLAYTPLVSALAPETCEDLQTPDTITLHSKVQATLETPGMAIPAVLPNVKPPPGFAWIGNPNPRKGAKTAASGNGAPAGVVGDEEEDNRPWFLRYWYVILPMVLLNLFGGGQDPNQAPPQEGQAPAGGSGAAAAAPAAAGGGASKRRGKRG